MKELQRQASPNIVIALAGNKADLADKRLVEYEVISVFLSYFKTWEVLGSFLSIKGQKESHCGLIYKYLWDFCMFSVLLLLFQRTQNRIKKFQCQWSTIQMLVVGKNFNCFETAFI